MTSIPTTVTVQIGSEVSAQVLPTASNTMQAIATSTPDTSFWETIVAFIVSIFS